MGNKKAFQSKANNLRSQVNKFEHVGGGSPCGFGGGGGMARARGSPSEQVGGLLWVGGPEKGSLCDTHGHVQTCSFGDSPHL